MKRQLKELLTLAGDMVQITVSAPTPGTEGARAAPEEGGALRLALKPVTMFSKRFAVYDGGQLLGDLTLGGEKGTKARLVLDAEVYEVRKDPRDGALVLERGGLPEAQALKTSIWKHAYEAEWKGGSVRFGRPAGDERTFEGEQDGRRVALVHKPTFWSRGVQVEAPAGWPVPFALFLAALALTAWDNG